MEVKWIIEKDVWHPKEEKELVEAIKFFGYKYKLMEYKPFCSSFEKLNFHPSACVIASGSINFTNDVMRNTHWVPGAYATYENYKCSAYYPFLGEMLLNSEYVFVPFGELTRLKEMLYRNFGKEGYIFIRPDSGEKLFKGKLVFDSNWNSEMDECRLWGVQDNHLALVSPPRNIDREWRFFVADKKVFTGCMYFASGLLKEEIELNKKAEELAQKVAEIYQPDRCFSIDICQSEADGMKALEINSGTSSGMYDCDIKKIVEEFSKIAWDDFVKNDGLFQPHGERS